jgi:hypothetical protein
LRKVKDNTPFGKYANAAWAEWAKWAERARRRPMGKAAGSDKFSGRIGQVLKWRKQTSSVAMKNGQVLKMDRFCSTGPDREGGGGPRLGWKKNKRGGRAEIKKKNFQIKNWIFLNLPRLGNLHKKI